MSAPAESPPRRELRRAVERNLADVPADGLVLVGCSGGADSLALALSLADCRDRGLVRAGAVIVDHQLQPDSERIAHVAGEQCVRLGLTPVEVIEVDVVRGPGNGGLESAARDARRAALLDAARRHGASAILLGHTLDDQAEGVLLGLARGSGARSLHGMAAADGMWRRPMLDLRRDAVRGALDGSGLSPYEDPHNDNPSFARVRVRNTVLPTLETELGPGVAEALARTASLLRADGKALDSWAGYEAATRISSDENALTLALDGLAKLPLAVRSRIVRQACLTAGVPGGTLTAGHLHEIERLISDWRGQGAVRLPGDREIWRESGRLVIQHVGPLDLLRG